MSFWKAGLPDGIARDTSLVILVINVVAPGVGTIIAGALSSEFQSTTVLVGIAQIVTMFILVGYIWAIVWSIMLVKKASGQENAPLLPRSAAAVDQETA